HGPAAFAPATPIGAPDAHVSPHGPTAFAPAMAHPGVQAGTPAPGWSSPPGAPAGGGPPFGPPSSVPPSSPPPAPGVAPSGSPKLYGQKTLDRMIQSAIVAAQPGAA